MFTVLKRKPDSEREQEAASMAHRPRIDDDELLLYGNLLLNYEKSKTSYLKNLKNYHDSYEKIYDQLYLEIRAREVSKVHQCMEKSLKKKIDEEMKDQNVEEILQKRLMFKKERLPKMLLKAEAYSHDQALSRMEETLPVLKQSVREGSRYLITSKFNNTYMGVVSLATKSKPSGWKVHISINPTLENLAKAWNIFRLIFLRHSLSYVKVANHERREKIESGKEITLYQGLDLGPDKEGEWKSLFVELEETFREKDVIPSPIFAVGDRPIHGSRYMSYRNDFCPDSKRTLRLDQLKPVIAKIAKELEACKTEDIVAQSIDSSLANLGISNKAARKEYGLVLIKHVQALLLESLEADLSVIYYNPFSVEPDPNMGVDLSDPNLV